jgi:hypothetical protein
VTPPAIDRRRALVRVAGTWRAFLELLGLSSVAIAQPFFDLLSKNGSLFVARDATSAQIVVLSLLIAFATPAALFLLEVLARWAWPQRAEQLHVGFLLGLAGLFGLQVGGSVNDSWWSALGVAVLAAVLVAVAVRFDAGRQLARFMAISGPVFLVLFLFASPVSDLAWGAGSVKADVSVGAPHRVVLVVLDEFPTMSLLDGSGAIDRELFPNFAALADTATWYRNATTVSPYTPYAVPAILTGRYPPSSSALPDASTYPESLFTMLGGSYELNVHEDLTSLCDLPSCRSSRGGLGELLGESLGLWLDFAAPGEPMRTLVDTESDVKPMRAAGAFIDSLEHGEESRLDFVHLSLPHSPWRFLPTMQDTGVTSVPAGAGLLLWATEGSAIAGHVQHLLQVGATDVVLGRVLARLHEIGAFDDSLVIVTADHGHAFTVGEPVRAVTEGNYPEVMWVPLLVKYPAQDTGRVDDRPAEIVDILPTVADVLDLDVPWTADGRSLLGEARVDPRRPLYQWGDYPFDPPDTLRPGPGETHLWFDGVGGFARVLAAEVAPGGPGDPHRIYRRLPRGELIGRAIEESERGQPAPVVVELNRSDLWGELDPTRRGVPWAFTEGVARGLRTDATLALALGGVVVSTTEAVPYPGGDFAFVGFHIPPDLAQPGRNRAEVFLIEASGTRTVYRRAELKRP